MTSASDTGNRIILHPKPITISRNLATMDTSKKTLVPYESEIITVIVGAGDEARKFYIHKELACKASPFFSSCLHTNHFPEGRTNSISLPEDNPEAFALILAKMYSVGKSVHDEPGWVTTETWFLAYVLADKLCMEEASASMLCNFMETASSDSYNLFRNSLPQTIFGFPDCAATKFLIAQVAWDFALNGYNWFCACEMEGDGKTCSWCQFFTKGGPTVVRVMKLVNGTKGEGINPSERGEEYWINKARELSAECGGNASE